MRVSPKQPVYVAWEELTTASEGKEKKGRISSDIEVFLLSQKATTSLLPVSLLVSSRLIHIVISPKTEM